MLKIFVFDGVITWGMNNPPTPPPPGGGQTLPSTCLRYTLTVTEGIACEQALGKEEGRRSSSSLPLPLGKFAHRLLREEKDCLINFANFFNLAVDIVAKRLSQHDLGCESAWRPFTFSRRKPSTKRTRARKILGSFLLKISFNMRCHKGRDHLHGFFLFFFPCCCCYCCFFNGPFTIDLSKMTPVNSVHFKEEHLYFNQ